MLAQVKKPACSSDCTLPEHADNAIPTPSATAMITTATTAATGGASSEGARAGAASSTSTEGAQGVVVLAEPGTMEGGRSEDDPRPSLTISMVSARSGRNMDTSECTREAVILTPPA